MKIIKNIIGFLMGFGTCDCGNTFWNNSDNPGIYYGNGSGRVICNDCYNKKKEQIEEQNRKMGSMGMDIKDKNCEHNWQRQSVASWWCLKCDSITALGCSHGGSIACKKCADDWEQQNK